MVALQQTPYWHGLNLKSSIEIIQTPTRQGIKENFHPLSYPRNHINRQQLRQRDGLLTTVHQSMKSVSLSPWVWMQEPPRRSSDLKKSSCLPGQDTVIQLRILWFSRVIGLQDRKEANGGEWGENLTKIVTIGTIPLLRITRIKPCYGSSKPEAKHQVSKNSSWGWR